MKNLIFVCATCLLSGSYVSADTDGVGAFAYQDSTGNRYGGTYGLKDGKVVEQKGNFPPDFSPPTFQFQDFDDFFPDYLRNLENVLQEFHPYFPPPPYIRPPSFIRRPYISPPIFNRTFESKVHQNLALDAAKKAFDLTSNQAGYIPNFASRFQVPFNNFGGFGGFDNMPGPHGFPGVPSFQIPDFGPNANTAFASAALGPEFSEQTAEINPPNPNNPNINKVSQVSSRSGPGGYKMVSTSSQVSSSIGPDGKPMTSRLAKTTINNNGDVKTYEVKN